MIDHIGLDVSNYEASKEFYAKALAPIDIAVIFEMTAEQSGTEAYCGMGSNGKPFFWFGEGKSQISPVHLAFSTTSRTQVDAFHNAAIAAGATDNGAPGPRPHYHENYYGAFVIDINGNNLEAVCHAPG